MAGDTPIGRVELERIAGEIANPNPLVMVYDLDLGGEIRIDERPQFKGLVPRQDETTISISVGNSFA